MVSLKWSQVGSSGPAHAATLGTSGPPVQVTTGFACDTVPDAGEAALACGVRKRWRSRRRNAEHSRPSRLRTMMNPPSRFPDAGKIGPSHGLVLDGQQIPGQTYRSIAKCVSFVQD